MHPAYSVIFFTTASGAGYGLIAWLGVAAAFGLMPTGWAVGFVGLGLGLALVTAGLLSSTAHLGRPERAWRAFSQWRTSWLSREGVAAVATYVPAGLLGLLWVFTDVRGPVFALLGLSTAALAIVTVYTTGMIYGSLPTIRSWRHPLTAPVYIVLAIASGGLLFNLVLALTGSTGTVPAWAAWPAALAAGAGYLIKRAWWDAADEAPEQALTPGDATGLKHLGEVRVLDLPHSTENFVMREMGYAVARRHALKLRRLAIAAAFVVPALALAALPALSPWPALALALLATVAAGIGLLVERWLFFAEARHVVMLYYGRTAT